MKNISYLFIASLSLFAIFSEGSFRAAFAQPAPLTVGAVLSSSADGTISGEKLVLFEEVQAFYQERAMRPLWLTGSGLPSKAAETALSFLTRAGEHGLVPGDYHAPKLAALVLQPEQSAAFELLLSDGVLTYARDIYGGRVFADFIDPFQKKKPQPELDEYRHVLVSLSRGDPVERVLGNLAPEHPQYQRTRKALAEYRRIESEGGWSEVPEGPPIKPRQKDSRMGTIYERLVVTGDVERTGSNDAHPQSYSAVIEHGIRKFQNRHGITEDGIIGSGTIKAMNVPVAERIEQLRYTLERIRWLPKDPGPERYIDVIIPSFKLRFFRGERPVLEMETINGTPYKSTPMLITELTRVEMNPYWNIPNSIAVEEIRPKAESDPGYLERHGIDAVKNWDDEKTLSPGALDWTPLRNGELPFRLRERPGGDNPLGQFKFVLRNSLAIYLHDTPGKKLFDRAERSFSHGCVRLERPFDLAVAVLVGQNHWDTDRITTALESGDRTIAAVVPPIPTYLNYWTAWVDENNAIHFADDIYGEDAQLKDALRRPETRFERWYSKPEIEPGGV